MAFYEADAPMASRVRQSAAVTPHMVNLPGQQLCVIRREPSSIKLIPPLPAVPRREIPAALTYTLPQWPLSSGTGKYLRVLILCPGLRPIAILSVSYAGQSWFRRRRGVPRQPLEVTMQWRWTVTGAVWAIATVALTGCALPPPTSAELAAMHNATSPPSRRAAHAAVVRYVSPQLEEPGSARYRFDPVRQSWLIAQGQREFGYFECGEVYAKEIGHGGFLPRSPFIVFFDPQSGDRVRSGMVALPATDLEGARRTVVDNQCQAITGHAVRTLYGG